VVNVLVIGNEFYFDISDICWALGFCERDFKCNKYIMMLVFEHSKQCSLMWWVRIAAIYFWSIL
jgi:hypothetical protein